MYIYTNARQPRSAVANVTTTVVASIEVEALRTSACDAPDEGECTSVFVTVRLPCRVVVAKTGVVGGGTGVDDPWFDLGLYLSLIHI